MSCACDDPCGNSPDNESLGLKNAFRSQGLSFLTLARIWKVQIREIEKSLLTEDNPNRFEKLLGSLRNAILQYRICRGLASFALVKSKPVKE